MYGHSLNYYNQSLFLFGGTSGYQYFRDVFRFELINRHWHRVIVDSGPNSTPEPRYKHTAVGVEDRLVIFEGARNHQRVGGVWEFNLSTSKWRPVNLRDKQPSPKFGHTACLTGDGSSILVFGGSVE